MVGPPARPEPGRRHLDARAVGRPVQRRPQRPTTRPARRRGAGRWADPRVLPVRRADAGHVGCRGAPSSVRAGARARALRGVGGPSRRGRCRRAGSWGFRGGAANDSGTDSGGSVDCERGRAHCERGGADCGVGCDDCKSGGVVCGDGRADCELGRLDCAERAGRVAAAGAPCDKKVYRSRRVLYRLRRRTYRACSELYRCCRPLNRDYKQLYRFRNLLNRRRPPSPGSSPRRGRRGPRSVDDGASARPPARRDAERRVDGATTVPRAARPGPPARPARHDPGTTSALRRARAGSGSAGRWRSGSSGRS